MGSPIQEKPSAKDRKSFHYQLKRFLGKHRWVSSLSRNNLVWGVLFLVAIVAILIPMKGFQEKPYQLNDILDETIRANEDLRIPDVVSTEKKKEERLNSLKTVYSYKDNQWQLYVGNIGSLFSIGRGFVSAELAAPIQSDAQLNENVLAANKDFILRIQNAVKESANINVPNEILQILVRNGFSQSLEKQIRDIVKSVLEQPIVNTTLYAPLPAGYLLRPVEDVSKNSLSIISTSNARSQMHRNTLNALVYMDQSQAMANWLQSFVEPTATLDTQEMERMKIEAQTLETLYFNISRGEVIGRQGDRIEDQDTLAKINFIRSSGFEGSSLIFLAISLSFFTGIFLFALHKYSGWYQETHKVSYNLFLLLSLTMFINLLAIDVFRVILDSITLSVLDKISDYFWLAPFAIGSMLVTLLVGARLATLYSVSLVFLSGFLFSNDSMVLLYALIGCLASIFGLRQYKERTALIKSGIALGLMNVITILAINLFNDQIAPAAEMAFSLSMGFLGGVLTSILVSFLLPIMESLFKIVTDIKLLELSNHDHPLLRELFSVAPGTFQHSIAVGYLAEAAAKAVGANPLFCRISCLYHDIGKMFKSHYFVENSDDLGKKHDPLSPHMSALIISNHVKEGIELGRKYRLPESIIDIIPQHHGTRLIKYFYAKAKAQLKPNDTPPEEAEFRYPGPKPQTREAGIIMIADSVEAAARSLDEPTSGRLKGTIKAIIDDTFLDGQLDECDLTLKDLTKIADSFLKLLLSMRHERIKYPGQEKRKPQKSVKSVVQDEPELLVESAPGKPEEQSE